MGLLCKLLGHKLVRVGEDKGLCSAHDCTRCGHHSPAIDWNAIAHPNGVIVSDKALSHTDMANLKDWAESASMKLLMAESHRPTRQAPPMPACKPPRLTEGEWQAEMLAESKRTNELLQKLIRQGESVESLASSATLTKRGGPIPHIPQPTDGR